MEGPEHNSHQTEKLALSHSLKYQMKGTVVPAHAMTAYRESTGIARLFLNLGTKWI